MNAVLESVDAGADLNASASNDDGSGDTTAAAPEGNQESTAPADGGGAPAAGAADAGAASVGAGSDAQPNAANAAEGKDKLVPISALHEARQEAKALHAKIKELEARPYLSPEQQVLLDKLNAKEAAANQPRDPDFLEDPKGYVDAKAKRIAEDLKATKEETARQSQQQQQQQHLNQILGSVAQHEAAFVKTTPDYNQAIDHIRGVRTAQLQMLYPQATQEQIQQQIAREEIGAAAQVLQGGGNPADFVYRYAKTLGYAPKQAPLTAANGREQPDKDAVRTLGNGGGAEKDQETPDDELGAAMKSALAERFGVRRKK